METEVRTVELTVISATHLKSVKKFGREQKCYAVAYVYPAQKQSSHEDPYGGVNPTWNATFSLVCYETHLHPPHSIAPAPAAPPAMATSSSPASSSSSASSSSPSSSHVVTVDIYSHGSGYFKTGDKIVGTASIPLQDINAAGKAEEGLQTALDVHRPSGRLQGTLNLSVKLGEKRTLGEYEDPMAPKQASYSSDQVGQSSSGYSPMGYSAAAAGAKSARGFNRKMIKTPSTGPNSFGGEDVVTGYPAPAYAFDPLGQVPIGQVATENQQFVQGTVNHGPYASYTTPTLYRGGRQSRRADGRTDRMSRGGRHGRKKKIAKGVLIVGGLLLAIILI